MQKQFCSSQGEPIFLWEPLAGTRRPVDRLFQTVRVCGRVGIQSHQEHENGKMRSLQTCTQNFQAGSAYSSPRSGYYLSCLFKKRSD